MDTINSLIAILLLLAANGFFVAAEFALVKAKSFRIEALANGGSTTARLTQRIQSNLEEYLAACQLGITMASLGLGWVGEPAVAALLEPAFASLGVPADVLHTAAFLVGFALFSSLHIVVGEQVPKTLAIRQPEPVSLWIAYPLHIAYLLALPMTRLLNRSTAAILGWFRVAEATHAEVLSGDEIKGLVATSQEHGEIQDEQANMLRNLFEFDQRLVGRVMIPRNAVHALELAADPQRNLEIIRDTEHSRFPLVDGSDEDGVIGIVLAKDIQRALLNGQHDPWSDLLQFSREPLLVPESQSVAQLFELMRTKRAHMACVVDEYGAFVGIVTLEDLIEEIVGEIHDETDDEETDIAVLPVSDGAWEADGLVSLGDLERIIGLQVPDNLDANTLSGLVMQRLARMPEEGDVVVEGDFQISVLDIIDRRVGRTRLEKIELVSDQPVIPDSAIDGELI